MRSGWAQDLALATGLAVALAVLGPYGSFLNGPLWQRLLFQLPCSWLAVGLIGSGVRLAAARWARGVRLWATTAVVAAAAMVPVTALNILLAQRLWPVLSARMTMTTWYVEGLLIAVPASFGFLHLALRRRERDAQQAEAQADAGLRPAPGLLGAPADQVLCLPMEDHYVRVHTAGGSRLVLATMGQAREALAGVPGLQVHRSWWVADYAVVGAELDGRNVRLRLSNGLTPPVSRSTVAHVRERGWLRSADLA